MVSVWFLFLVMVVIVVVFFPILLGVLLVYLRQSLTGPNDAAVYTNSQRHEK